MGINKNLGFSAEDRTENIRRIGEVAKLFVDSGVIALSSFISPYRQTATRCEPCTRRQAWNLSRSSSIVPWKRLKAVTPRVLYKKARAGEIKNFTGIDDPYEAPRSRRSTCIPTSKAWKTRSMPYFSVLRERGIIGE